MGMLFEETKKTTDMLSKRGYTVVEMWEHDWMIQRKKYLDIIIQNKELIMCPKIDIRDGFYGGRTEVFDLYAKETPDRQIACMILQVCTQV
jgi:hypothetical protein